MGAVKTFYHLEIVPFEDYSYIATVADFPNGCSIFADGQREVATGKNVLGATVTLPLDVPLCMGCDKEIVGATCHDCGVLFTGNERDAA